LVNNNVDLFLYSDLPFKKGDVISLAHVIDANWYEGFLGNKRGSIPKNFLEVKYKNYCKVMLFCLSLL